MNAIKWRDSLKTENVTCFGDHSIKQKKTKSMHTHTHTHTQRERERERGRERDRVWIITC